MFFIIIQCKLKIWISIIIFTFYIINQIYLIIFHLTPLFILIKWNNLFAIEVLEQPGSKTRVHVHNVVTIREWRHINVDKQRMFWLMLTLLRPEARSRSHDISMFCSSWKCWFHLRQLHWECKYKCMTLYHSQTRRHVINGDTAC